MFHILFNLFTQMTRLNQNFMNRHYYECGCATCGPVAEIQAIKRFVTDCFYSSGLTDSNSEILAEAIVQADYRGIFSEGVSRLEQYINEIQLNICDPKAQPQIEEESTSVAVVNGNNGFGQITGTFCMDIAMEKALCTGIGMVAAKGSNYYGMASLYTMQAAKKGYIGLSFSNGIPYMVPPGGLEVALGANPISLAAPAHCDSLVVDMSTTAVTLAKIKQYEKKKNELPKGWAVNRKGQAEQDPEKAMIFKMLSPLGGEQKQKGYSLALVVETLTGLLADSNYGPNIPIPKEKCRKEPLNLGHSFIAINPEKFVPNFASRLTKLLNQLRKMKSVDSKKPILVPGDRERRHMRKVDREGGVRYSRDQIEILENLAKKLGVPSLEVVTPYTDVQQNKKKS